MMKLYLTPKTLKKIIKMLVLFILACILIYFSNTLSVNATSSTTSTILSDITFPLAVEIRDNISGFPSLNFSTNYGYDENYTSAWINKEIVSMNSAGVVVSIPEVLECGHSYVLYNYWALNGAYMIDYSASSSRVLGVGLGLGNIPNLSITESINSGRFPTFEYVTTVATGINQYADFTHVSMSYIKFTNNTCNGAQRNLYFSQMSNISATFQSNKLAYLGYRLIDTTTLSSSDHAQLDRIEESINNLTLADVENKLNEIQEEQKNTSDAIDEQIQQDKEQHEAEMEQDKQQHEEQMQQDKELQQVCTNYGISDIKYSGYLNESADLITNKNYGVTDYINISGAKIKTLTSGTGGYYCYYNAEKNLIGKCQGNSALIANTILSPPANAVYIRFTFHIANNQPIYEICRNGNQVLNDTQKETNDKLDDLEDSITDSSSPDTSGLSDAAGWLPPGPVDSLVNLPINLLNSLLGNMGTTCTNIDLTLPFVKKNFTIPCPTDLLSRLGNTFLTFWEGFGLIAGCWCLYKYFIALYKWVESALTMDEKEQLGKWGGV